MDRACRKGSPPLPEEAYLLPSWSWWLCVFLGNSSYARDWWARDQYLRAAISSVHEGLRLHLILLGPKWCGLQKNLRAMVLARYWRVPGSWGGSAIDKQVPKSCPFMTVRGRPSIIHSWVKLFLGRWSLLFGQERWGHIQYGMHGSPVVCRRLEPVVSRFMGHNQWLMIIGV
jgi:hypothetical protein